MATLVPLPIYPSTRARKDFSASQLIQFHVNLSNALAQVITLPPVKWDTSSTRVFVSSYACDGAQQTLETLIWEDTNPGKNDDRMRQSVLVLAEKIASSAPGLELRTLLDLCIAFSSNIARLRTILSAALDGAPDLPALFSSEVVPAFTSLLTPSQSAGLYGLRKTARCLTSLLRPSPPALVRSFAHSRDFIIALARAYDDGLTTISRAYGGIRTHDTKRELDHWEHIWLDTKVDIIDAFHLLMTTITGAISSTSGTLLAEEADRIFGTVFALLDITPSATAGSADVVPFLNQSLVADYQYAYGLTQNVSSALRRASHEDVRIKRLEATLGSVDIGLPSRNTKDPGALGLILSSSRVAPKMPHKTVPTAQPVSTDKGKAKATAPALVAPHDPDLDLKVTQVLDIFPHYSPAYIRKLLVHPSSLFCGDAERVIEALLEGTAPDEDALESESAAETLSVIAPVTDAPIERRNVFDGEDMDLTRMHVGKKTQDAVLLTRSRAETERMKAEILRLTEAMSEDSDEERGGRALDVFDLDEDLDGVNSSAVKVQGDGEDSDDDEGRGVQPVKPETILEMAYIRDPKLFDRDAQTRRSKSRANLKQQTGWSDEQIEGWRIMLDRNPKKDRILQKHEFSGNRTINAPIAGGTRDGPTRGQRGRGRDRARSTGRGQGRGRGGGSQPGEKNDDIARERAFKEKHKSTNRKRGHDKKAAKTGAGPSA